MRTIQNALVLKMATARFPETLENHQHATNPSPETRNCILSCAKAWELEQKGNLSKIVWHHGCNSEYQGQMRQLAQGTFPRQRTLDATIEEILEAVFSMRNCTGTYNEDQQGKQPDNSYPARTWVRKRKYIHCWALLSSNGQWKLSVYYSDL